LAQLTLNLYPSKVGKTNERKGFGNAVQTAFLKNFNFFYKNFFLYILDRFDALILKIIFKKIKKHHFDAFQHGKYFEKQPQPHSQTD
jgi:hypothetical protein